MGVDGIVFDVDGLHGIALPIVSLDENGKPNLFGDDELIFFDSFSIDVV